MAEKKGCFRDIRFFVGCYGIVILTDIMSGVMKKSSLTTLERRFDLPSTIVALMASSFQIGNMTTLLFVSYFGSRWNRPRAIFWGSMLLILGNLVATLPQFIGGRYEYEDVTSNKTSSTTQVGECTNNSTIPVDNCEERTPTSQLYILIVIGMVINGIGGTPHQPLGLSYIDDFAHESNSPLYLGVTHTIGLLGPIGGYVLSAVFLTMWVDIGWVNTDEITIKPTHPSWVGAWWLGLLICTSGIAITVIPMYFFPKKMKKQEIKKKTKKSDKKNSDKLDNTDMLKDVTDTVSSQSEGKENKIKQNESVFAKEKREILETLKRIFSNKIYLLILAKFCFAYGSFVGIINFFPKYLEVGFGVSAGRANLLTGLINVPCLVAGILLGSILLKRLNLTSPGIIKLIGCASICATMCMVPLLIFGCDTIDIAGITVPYSEALETELPNELSQCNMNCGCFDGTYAPVCGSDGISYISPCHAGCTGVEFDEYGYKQNFVNCGCVKSNETNGIGDRTWAKPERCEFSKCPHLLFPAVVLKAGASFFGGLGSTPMYIFLIRSVAQQDKAFAIGVYLMTVRILAIPGPLVYGALIDSTCLYWGQKACSKRAYCKVYDNVSYRLRFYGLMLICQFFAFLTIIVLYIETKKKYKKEQKKKTEEKSLNGKNDSISDKKDEASSDLEEEILLTQKEKNEVSTTV